MVKSWKLCKLGHFQNALTKKRKLIYSSSVQGLLHNSQSFFQAIFYLYPDFLFISYTRTKEVMFRALMTPRITSFQKDTASRVYIFNSYKRVLLKELFFLFVILKAFLARQKRKCIKYTSTIFPFLIYSADIDRNTLGPFLRGKIRRVLHRTRLK